MSGQSSYPLTGVKVLELEGIGPGPLGCCMLCDFGADVITVCRVSKGKVKSQNDPVSRGKRSIAMNLKSKEVILAFREMVKNVDVVVDPFRPGVMEKLGLGPDVLCADNPRLIFARMTGWGQSGDPNYVHSAGHDANYISLAGTLDLFRRGDERPLPPGNFAGDYAGGGTMLAMGVLLAIIEREKSGNGQVIDVAMTDGANYVALPLFKWMQPGGIIPQREDGHLNANLSTLHQGPHWSNTYTCKCGGWVSVQSMEPQFYKILIDTLGLDKKKLPHQYDSTSWPWMKKRFEGIFMAKTRDEWEDIFKGKDACVAPVLSAIEAAKHPHNVARGSFAPTPEHPGLFEPSPAPQLSRTPGHRPRMKPKPGFHTVAVLDELGLSSAQVARLMRDGHVIDTSASAAKL
jgi:alpha-methylacyl-CoA racemase